MQHIHLDQVASTQTHLLEEFSDIPRHLLISCEKQTEGFGRRGSGWDSYQESLCFSCTISPNKNMSLTALEIPIIIRNFFEIEFKKDLQLKWPNDLMKNSKKCGGIIISSTGKDNMVLGLGLNIGKIENIESYPIAATSVFDIDMVFCKRNLALKIYRFILDNRLSEAEVLAAWKVHCTHIDKEVQILEDSNGSKGVFKGIGPSGQALLDIDGNIQEFFTGTLRF